MSSSSWPTPDSTTITSSRRSSTRSSGSGEPDVRLEVGSGSHAEQTAAMLVGDRARRAGSPARRDAGLRRHQLDAGGGPGRRQARRAPGPCRGRPALVRHAHARGGQPRRHRPSLAAAVLPVRDGGREPRGGGHPQRRRARRRRHGRPCARVRPRGQRALGLSRSARPGAGLLRARDRPPPGEHRAAGARPAGRGPEPGRGARRAARCTRARVPRSKPVGCWRSSSAP